MYLCEIYMMLVHDIMRKLWNFIGQIQIEKDYLQTAFSILEEQPMDMLLGLDMLKRHQVG